MLHQENVPIAKLTSFKNAGKIENLFTFDSVKELQEFLPGVKNFFVLGKGSNTLINPSGPIKNFLKISHQILPIRLEKPCHLWLNGGLSSSQVLKQLAKFKLSGLEFISGVPASIGGMTTMNFGAWGQNFAQFITKVHILDENGQEKILTNSELNFGYRHSIFQEKKWIILEACFKLNPLNAEAIRQNSLAVLQKRLTTQPLKAKTFGSTFINPPNNWAAKLIEDANLKGYGNAKIQISSQHANFMINLDNASFNETKAFIKEIQTKIKIKTNILLQTEVIMV